MKHGDAWTCGLGLLVALLLRSITSLFPYSGQGSYPRFGDYEAQRHWQEITLNLPPAEWYRNSSLNDLEYWGLDYPPLTAYHSWALGWAARRLDAAYVQLGESRGTEGAEHKLFMRYTVLAADLATYLPAVVWFHFAGRGRAGVVPWHAAAFLAAVYPGQVLVDHGHFQYNCVALGLAVLAAWAILADRHVSAAVLFSLSLNYKQISLYYSLPFFFYLLSHCVPRPGRSALQGLGKLAAIGGSVLATFAVVWWPFLRDLDTLRAVLSRLFPLDRGVFEDKVANFWCIFDIFSDVRAHVPNAALARYCTCATLVAVLPTSLNLFLRPTKERFLLSLVNCSLGFYLFSYMVHEKTILFVAAAVVLQIREDPVAAFWFLNAATFSMAQLFANDGLTFAFFPLVQFFSLAYFLCYFEGTSASLPSEVYETLFRALMLISGGKATPGRAFADVAHCLRKNSAAIATVGLYTALLLSNAAFSIVAFLQSFIRPPAAYPDLFSVMMAAMAFFHFLAFFVYFNVRQFRASVNISKLKMC